MATAPKRPAPKAAKKPAIDVGSFLRHNKNHIAMLEAVTAEAEAVMQSGVVGPYSDSARRTFILGSAMLHMLSAVAQKEPPHETASVADQGNDTQSGT